MAMAEIGQSSSQLGWYYLQYYFKRMNSDIKYNKMNQY
jgi:hypothetical protein